MRIFLVLVHFLQRKNHSSKTWANRGSLEVNRHEQLDTNLVLEEGVRSGRGWRKELISIRTENKERPEDQEVKVTDMQYEPRQIY